MSITIPRKIIAVFGNNYLNDNGKDEVRFLCPKCIERKGTPDTKGHLYVNTKSFIFHCYRCDYSGRIGRIKVDDSLIFDEDCSHEVSELISSVSEILNPSDTDYKFKIPIDKVTMSSSATDYLLSRGFTYDQMNYYDLRVGNLNQEFGRIIIPNKVDRLVYTDMYAARSYIGQEPKYHNPFDVKKSSIVFNLHRIKENSPVILVEGPLTAIAAGYHAVASFGKSLSRDQASQIISKHPSVIYVNYDYGAEEYTDKACRLFRSLSKEVKIMKTLMKDDRDAADLSKEEYVDCLKNSVEYNQTLSDLESII